jgi:hypothetical protein
MKLPLKLKSSIESSLISVGVPPYWPLNVKTKGGYVAMPKIFKCLKCKKEFQTLADYMNPTKHPCVKGKPKSEIPSPRVGD